MVYNTMLSNKKLWRILGFFSRGGWGNVVFAQRLSGSVKCFAFGFVGDCGVWFFVCLFGLLLLLQFV